MILKREFYFVRHGQTDHNAMKGVDKGDHPHDIPLNDVGREQAMRIEPVVAALPVKSVCVSPMRRAKETKEIVTVRMDAAHYEVDNLGECSAKIWREMGALGMGAELPREGEARGFMDRVRLGVNEALSLPGPVLIVAHGGIHWALCCLMGIEGHSWAIENCGVVHFRNETKWIARRMNG